MGRDIYLPSVTPALHSSSFPSFATKFSDKYWYERSFEHTFIRKRIEDKALMLIAVPKQIGEIDILGYHRRVLSCVFTCWTVTPALLSR